MKEDKSDSPHWIELLVVCDLLHFQMDCDTALEHISSTTTCQII